MSGTLKATRILITSKLLDTLSIFLSLLILISTVGGSIYKDNAINRVLVNLAFIQKLDVVHWTIKPLVEAGMTLKDNSILRQAYFIHLLNTGGYTSDEAKKKVTEVNTIEDLYQRIPTNTVEQVNSIIESSNRIGNWLNNLQIFLTILLIIIQILSFRTRTKEFTTHVRAI